MPKARAVSQTLAETRGAYGELCEETIRPLLGLTKREQDQLGFAGIAHLIEDQSLRQNYIDRAVAMLQANIADISPLATQRRIRDSSAAVVWSLLAAAAAYRYDGPVSALAFAAFIYWGVFEYERSQKAKAEAHNEQVASWRETVADWESVIDDLRRIET